MCEQHPFSYESHMHFLLYENHIISYDTHAITSYASHMTAFLYKSFHVKFIFILYDNYVWRNWLCKIYTNKLVNLFDYKGHIHVYSPSTGSEKPLGLIYFSNS